VSGLFLQYDNPHEDRYLGQWFQEVDSLDIENGDFVVYIRVWYTQNLTDTGRFGQVSGIEVATFRGLRKRVLYGGKHRTYDFEYYANPLEDLVRYSIFFPYFGSYIWCRAPTNMNAWPWGRPR